MLLPVSFLGGSGLSVQPYRTAVGALAGNDVNFGFYIYLVFGGITSNADLFVAGNFDEANSLGWRIRVEKSGDDTIISFDVGDGNTISTVSSAPGDFDLSSVIVAVGYNSASGNELTLSVNGAFYSDTGTFVPAVGTMFSIMEDINGGGTDTFNGGCYSLAFTSNIGDANLVAALLQSLYAGYPFVPSGAYVGALSIFAPDYAWRVMFDNDGAHPPPPVLPAFAIQSGSATWLPYIGTGVSLTSPEPMYILPYMDLPGYTR